MEPATAPSTDAKLKNFVARTHREKRLLRFWAVPDNEACWRVLYETGVDLINTDKLSALSTFLGHAP
jgi:alkaline phosphatase